MPRQSLAGRASEARGGLSARSNRMFNSGPRTRDLKTCDGTVIGDDPVWQWMSRAARTQAFGCVVMVGVAVAWAGYAMLIDRSELTPQAETIPQVPHAAPPVPLLKREPGYPAVGTSDHGAPMNPAPPARSRDDLDAMNGPDVGSPVMPQVDMWSRAPALSLDAALAELDQDAQLAEAWAAEHLPGPMDCSPVCIGPNSDASLSTESPLMPVPPPGAPGPQSIESHATSPAEAGPSAPPNEGDIVLTPPSDADLNDVPHGQQPGVAPALAG